MVSYTEPDLEIVLELDFRFGINRKYLEDIILRNHEPRLELTVTRATGQGDPDTFNFRDPNTSTAYDMDSILLSFIANHLAETKVAALSDIKLSRGTESVSDRYWRLDAVASPENIVIRSLYEGNEEYPVGNDDGTTAKNNGNQYYRGHLRANISVELKRCLQIRTPRLAYSNLKTWATSVDGLFRGLRGPKPFSCWTNDSCGFGVQIDLADSPLSFEANQNLITMWGVYEKEIEKFHPRQRRHPHNDSAISLRFGDGGPGDSHADIRADTQDGRAAFVAKVYTARNIVELGTLVNSSLAKGNRKVHTINRATQGSSKCTITFGELGGTMVWGVLSVWCTFVCTVVRYAHLMANEDVTFHIYGEPDLEDLLEIINLPAAYHKAFLARVRQLDTEDKPETPYPPVQNDESSQGGPRERPPDHWIRRELETFKALGVPSGPSTHTMQYQGIHPLKAPDLTGDIHPIFNLEYWVAGLNQEDWNNLRQTFILSTRLLEVATPWFGAFLPRARCGITNGANPHIGTINILLEEKPTPAVLKHVREGLLAMEEYIIWDCNDEMLPRKRRWGKTHRGKRDEASGLPIDPTADEHVKRDQQERNVLKSPRRHMCITIAEHLVLAVLDAEPGTEKQLFAVFFMAIILVSELGHAVWLANFDNLPYADVRVGNDVHTDLGNSLIGWIFRGWYPKPNYFGKQDEEYHFVRGGLHWNKLFQRSIQRPLYATAYSLPVHHIQRALSQRQWELVDHERQPIEAARKMLKPDTPFQQRHTARVAKKVQRVDPRADWGGGMGEAKNYEDANWEVTPPPTWDRAELIAAGALGCSVSPPSLMENINPIFAYGNWTRAPEDLVNAQGPETPSLTRDEYEKLKPAMTLATLLLKVGAPWFASLLPEIKWYRQTAHGDFKYISAVQSPGHGDLAATRTALETMAGHIHLDQNSRQLPEDSQLGLNSRGHRSKPDENGDYKYESVDFAAHSKLDAVEKAKNLPYRRIQISLSSQLIIAILDSAPDSEKYLQAVYSLATTLTHELGHTALYANFNWPLGGPEAPVQGEAEVGLGRSLIAWIHGGWDLCDSPELDNEGRATFRYGCSWRKWYKHLSRHEWLPRYWTHYSIPVHFIQRQFMQATWDTFDLDNKPEEAADALLRLLAPFRKGEHARKAERISYSFWNNKDVVNQWHAGDEPDEDDDRVDPYYEDPDWDDDPMAPGL